VDPERTLRRGRRHPAGPDEDVRFGYGGAGTAGAETAGRVLRAGYHGGDLRTELGRSLPPFPPRRYRPAVPAPPFPL
jgi:hypothetical protein